MIINLNKFTQQKAQLNHMISGGDWTNPGGLKKLKELIRFLEDIESDLETGGESAVELDKPRIEAIEERNKTLAFMKKADDI